MTSYYIKNQHRTCITLNSRKDELYKQDRWYFICSSQENLTLQMCLYQILTHFFKTANEQLSQNKMKTPKHVILEWNFYAKMGSSPTSCACKRICCLVFKNVSKITEEEIKCDLLVKVI